MRTNNLIGKFLACLAGSAILMNFALAQATDDKTSTEARPQSDTRSDNGSRAQIQIPNRPPRSLFQGEQGSQKTEISFDPATQLVTVKMLVQDPNGYFIPNIRRDNFVVYEDGIRQHNATVEIEHSPVSVAMLLEWGGRYSAFNKALAEDVPRVAYQMLDELGRQDKIAIFRYGDRLERLADFSRGHEVLEELLTDFDRPEFSELNFYDALISTLNYMKPVSGRKAVVLISSGVDTFSKTRYEDVLRAARFRHACLRGQYRAKAARGGPGFSESGSVRAHRLEPRAKFASGNCKGFGRPHVFAFIDIRRFRCV